MDNNKRDFDYEALKAKTLKQLLSGKDLFSKGGAFAPLLKDFLEAALQAELEEHMAEEPPEDNNRKNGYTSKKLRTATGTIELDTPRDRNSTFSPEIVKKRETILAHSLEKKIIAMYGRGMSFRDISAHIKEMYDTDISAATLSAITDKVIPLVKQWQARPLEAVYCIAWLDGLHYKVKSEGRVVTRCVYNVLALNKAGHKEILGVYVSESEGANFWLSVLTDLQTRGVQDILIACIDNLKGFSQAITTVFPKTEVQSCIIHQIRNSMKYVSTRQRGSFMKDMKPVYQAATKDLAEMELDKLENRWGQKYPIAISSWRRNWENLSTYFRYPMQVRKLIYTTNTIEGYHRQVRKVTKTKGAFTSDMALLKLIYLVTKNIEKKWTVSVKDWGVTISQLCIIFGEDRLKFD